MSTTLKLIEQGFNTTHWSLHTTSQHTAKWHQDHHKQLLHNDPQRNLNNYSEEAEEGARWEELHSHRPFGHKTRSLESRIQWKIKKNQCLHEWYTSNC